jgi:iron complex outermembrane receptor protein
MSHSAMIGLALAALAAPVSMAGTTADTTPPAAPVGRGAPAAPPAMRDAGSRIEDEPSLDEIVVTGRREPGAVIGDIAPETQLSAEEIRALGVGSVTELLAALGPQLGSSRGRGGRPVVLLNGVRISGFAEIRDLPAEAILRTDILPEEVALRYGYRADQRVVNIVLRPRFRAFTGEMGARSTTEGGRESTDLNGNWLNIRRDDRWQVDVKARRDAELLESDRQIVGPLGVANADAAYRSLAPQVDQLTANFVMAKPLGEGAAATLNLSIDDTRRLSLLGLRSVSGSFSPLRREVEALDSHLGGIVQGTLSGWRWSATLNADRNDSTTTTTGESTPGRSRNDAIDVDLVANGAPLDLPAGALSLTLKAAVGSRSIESRSRRGLTTFDTDLSRQQRDLQFNVDLPLWRGALFDGQTGMLGANLNYALEDVSGFGGLRTTGYGLNGSIARKLRLITSVTDEQGPPSMQQLGAAVIATPFVRSFDFVRGETVEVTRVDGGNPLLAPDRRKVFKIGLGSRPLEDIDLDLNADFVRTRSRDIITALPLATPDLERAFGSRFQRDPGGRLQSIDARPVNLFGRDRDEIRLTLNLSRPWGPQPEPPMPPRRTERGGRGDTPGTGSAAPGAGTVASGAGAGTAAPGAPPVDDAARRARMAQMGERFTAFARRGSLQFSLVYTERLTDEVTIAPGLPVLDLLEGDTLFDTNGNPRREVEAQFGGSRNGFGGRLVAQWRSGSRIVSSAPSGSRGDLDFDSLTTVNLRLFADLGLLPVARQHAFLRGARVTLAVGNLFNSRPVVRDAAGRVPLNYQADLLDPQGRSIRLGFRKVFLPNFSSAGGRTG